MSPKKEAALLDAIRNKYPQQAESLETFIWAGWKFNGHGRSDSVNIKRKFANAYIRTDGTMGY